MEVRKKVIIIAPSPYSLYSTSVYSLLERKDIQVAGIILKKFTASRFFAEYKRDGRRLFRKIWKKLVLRERAYKEGVYNIVAFRKEQNITLKSLMDIPASTCKIKQVEDINGDDVVSFIDAIKPELIVFTGGGLISQKIIEKAGKGVLNCHMGVLPDFKGMDVVEWPILAGQPDKVGCTVHLMDKGVDTGAILAVKHIGIEGAKSFRELRGRIEPVMCSFITDVAHQYLTGAISPVEQDPDEGKQYFILEPRLYQKALSLLQEYTS